ncbi:hypothetical protein [Azospirillum lipoferum]|uniref:Uncharacterized protein n=1 Tax=Azospirillum lipoferum (strain 4B) TaxID=862719 RepID=G7Z3V8_AZOL4|nr:hypothetical protein [Azospirillum lipoferum]CBS86080.1 Protein of unknown function [Azospirillum lipoferum 4B]
MLPRGAVDIGGPVHLYLDGSGSMRGFVTVRGESPYLEALRFLPQSLARSAIGMQVFRFATGIEPRPHSGKLEAEILSDGFYRTQAGGSNTQVSAGATHLHEVLRRAASESDTTSVIVSDLFLSAAEVHGGDSGPLRKTLADILHKDLTVAIIGVQAPFNGRVFDLATTPSGVQLTNGFRPFYVLLVGPDARVRSMYDTLRSEVLEGMPAGSHHLAVYSRRPLPKRGWVQRIDLRDGAATASLLSKDVPHTAVEQIAIGRRAGGAEVTLEQEDTKTGWDAAQAAVPDITQASAKSTLHFFGDGRHGCENGWVEDDDHPGLLRLTQGKTDRLSFDVFPQPAATYGLRPKVPYTLDAAVMIPALQPAPPVRHWIQEWGYDASQEKALLDRLAQREKKLTTRLPAKGSKAAPEPEKVEAAESADRFLFPTLNLLSLNDLMVRIIRDNYSAERIHAFRIAFKLD